MAAWWAGLAAAALIAVLLARVLRLEGDDSGRALLAMLGWAVAGAAGWFFSVAVGGPLAGTATAVALHYRDNSFRRALLSIGASALGLWGGWLAGRDLGTLPSLGTALLGVLLVAFLAGGWRSSLPSRWLSWVAGGGVCWVGAWALATGFVPPFFHGYGAPSTEVVLAFSLMGMLCAGLLKLDPGALGTALLAWLAGGLLAALAGIATDVALRAVYATLTGHVAATTVFLDVGHVIGMPLGGTLAIIATYRAWRSSSSSSNATRLS